MKYLFQHHGTFISEHKGAARGMARQIQEISSTEAFELLNSSTFSTRDCACEYDPHGGVLTPSGFAVFSERLFNRVGIVVNTKGQYHLWEGDRDYFFRLFIEPQRAREARRTPATAA